MSATNASSPQKKLDLVPKPLQNFAEVEHGKTTWEVAAEKAGFGNQETYRQAKHVVDHAEPEIIDVPDEARFRQKEWHRPFYQQICW
jgi:hypothetical protein